MSDEFYKVKNKTHVSGIKQYSGTVIDLLNNITWSAGLTDSDLNILKEVLSDLKETIEDVEFSLFNSTKDKDFLDANNKLHQL